MPPKITKCGNETSKKAIEIFEDIAEAVTRIITRPKDTTDVRNKTMERLYSNFLGKHVRIVETIIKPQSGKLFQVSKSNMDNFLYDIRMRVSPDGTKNGDQFKRRWVTWFHVRKSEIADKGLEEKDLWLVSGP